MIVAFIPHMLLAGSNVARFCETGPLVSLSCEKSLFSVTVVCGGSAHPTCHSAIYGNASPQIDAVMSLQREANFGLREGACVTPVPKMSPSHA